MAKKNKCKININDINMKIFQNYFDKHKNYIFDKNVLEIIINIILVITINPKQNLNKII